MSTPLSTPLTLNITVESQEELLALLLRCNLDAENIRYWYHDFRGRTNVRCPDIGLGGVFKALKAHMESEGFSMTTEDQPAPAGKSVDIKLS